MPKQRRPENKGLPERWRFVYGAYYYSVPKGLESQWDNKQTFFLGKTLSDAHLVWGQRIKNANKSSKVADILDRYALEIIPKKAPKTQKENRKQMVRVRAVFGAMDAMDITPRYIYAYIDKRGAPRAAKLEKALLSHALTKAVEWGIIEHHPFIGEVRLAGPKTKGKRYVHDREMDCFYSLKPKRRKDGTEMIQAYAELKQVTGLRKTDMLRLKISSMLPEGIYVKPNKTQNSSGKEFIIARTEAVEAAWKRCIAARPCLSPWLFCTRRGVSYLNEKTGEFSGFDSVWQRYMARVLEETDLEEAFPESAIRTKTGSDSKTLRDAQELLGHTDERTTRTFYRMKPEVVKPLR